MQQHHAKIAPAYSDDFYAWTQQQAKLLRMLRTSDFEAPKGLDLEHLAEEVADLGSAELNSVKSFIRQIFLHLIKAASDTGSRSSAHWGAEALTFQADMLDRYTPSMRRLIDLQPLWERALKGAELALEGQGTRVADDVPEQCPFTVDDLTVEHFDFKEALRKLRK